MSIREVDVKTVENLFVPSLTKFTMKAVREFDKSDMKACIVDYPEHQSVNTVVSSLRRSVERLGVDVTVKKWGTNVYMLKGGFDL